VYSVLKVPDKYDLYQRERFSLTFFVVCSDFEPGGVAAVTMRTIVRYERRGLPQDKEEAMPGILVVSERAEKAASRAAWALAPFWKL